MNLFHIFVKSVETALKKKKIKKTVQYSIFSIRYSLFNLYHEKQNYRQSKISRQLIPNFVGISQFGRLYLLIINNNK